MPEPNRHEAPRRCRATQLLRGELRRHDVDEHARAPLEPGDGHELRPDVGVPVEWPAVRGGARCGTRGCRTRRRAARACGRARCARPARRRPGRPGRTPGGGPRGCGGSRAARTASRPRTGTRSRTRSSSCTTREPSATSASTVAHRMQPPSKPPERPLLVEDLAGHERHAEKLAVGVGQRGAGLTAVVHDGLRVAHVGRPRRAPRRGRGARP